ncbi:MAG: hypothetical protein QG577_812, partial [Thermodesulfobacteriota bacterium]|nr:hypothetical protein [Thermodesulfobacteriota bacterium]
AFDPAVSEMLLSDMVVQMVSGTAQTAMTQTVPETGHSDPSLPAAVPNTAPIQQEKADSTPAANGDSPPKDSLKTQHRNQVTKKGAQGSKTRPDDGQIPHSGTTPITESSAPAESSDARFDETLKAAVGFEKEGNLQEALASYEKAITESQKSGRQTQVIQIHLSAAKVAGQLGIEAQMTTHIRQAMGINQGIKNQGERISNQMTAAQLAVDVAHYALALELLEEASKSLPSVQPADAIKFLQMAAFCQMRLGRHNDAAKSLGKLTSLQGKDAKPLDLARINLQLGDTHLSRSDYRQAMECFRKTEKVVREVKDKKILSETLYRVAIVQEIAGDPKAFSKSFQEAQKLSAGKGLESDSPFSSLAAGIALGREGKNLEALNSLSRSLSLFETDKNSSLAARTRLSMAEIQLGRSKLASTLELAGKALEQFRTHTSHAGEAEALLVISQVYFRQGFIQKALEYAREASAIAKTTGNKDLSVRAGIALAEIHLGLGDIEFTAKLLKDAVEDAKTGISLPTKAFLRLSIARYRLSRENLDGAFQDGVEARKEFQEIHDVRGVANCDQLLGLVYELRGDKTKASATLQRALEAHRSLGDTYGEARDLTALGVHFKNSGDYGKALASFKESYELRKSLEDKRGLAACLVNIGNLYRLQNVFSEAQTNLEKARAIYKDLGDKKGEADSLASLGQLELARGLRSTALERFHAALRIHREVKDSRGIVTDLTSIGSLALARGDLDAAAVTLDEALKLNKGIRNPKGELAILSELAMLKRARNNSKEALTLLNQALDMAKKSEETRSLSGLHLKRAVILEDLGQYQKAIEILNTTLVDLEKIGDRKGRLLALGELGVIQTKVEDYENALQNLKEAVRLRNELGLQGPFSPDIDQSLGEIYEGFRDFDQALNHYHRALSACQSSGNEPLAGKIYDRIGRIYYAVEEYSKAKDFLEDALRVSNETRNVAAQKTQLIRLGDVYSRLGDSETALKHQQRALALTRETSDKKNEAKTLTRIGILNQVLGKPRLALESYREAKDIRSQQGDRRGTNENLLQIALVTSTLGDADSAVEDLRSALAIAQSTDDRSMLWKAYFIMGRCLESKKSLGEALESYRRALAILESMDDEASEENDDDDFLFGGRRALYETTLRVLMTLARKDPQGAYDSQALKIVEKIKAVDFERTLSAVNVDAFSDLPSDLLIKEKSLRLTLRNLNARLETERSKINPDQAEIKKLVDERRAKEKSFRELKGRLSVDYPAYSELQYPKPITMERLQKDVIDSDEAVLEYMVTRGRTYLFAIDKNRFHTYSIDYSSQEVEKDVEALTRPLLRSDTLASWDPSVAYRLYSKIIKPLEYFLVGKKTVTVIPHGALTSLPFEMLVDSKEHATKRFWSAGDRPSYLVEKYAFAYAPSSSLLAYVRNRKHEKQPGWNFVGFGDA